MTNANASSTADVIDRSLQVLNELYNNIELYNYEQISKLLSDFRILTREKTLTNDTLDERCMRLLVDCSRNNHTEAQKCLSNLILNYAHLREKLVKPYVECFDDRLRKVLRETEGDDRISEVQETKAHKLPVIDSSKSCEILYYDLRIIFLLSALCSASRANIRDRLLSPILQITQREAERLRPENYLLIIESLKTLFNLTLDKCIDTNSAAGVIKKLFSVVGTEQDRDAESISGARLDATDQLLVNLIHLLTNMPEEVYHELSDRDVNKVLAHLDEQLRTFTNGICRDTILPVLNACANICRYKKEVRYRWFNDIIGKTQDFTRRPEEYDTMRGRLVKLMTSVDIHIKELAAEFLYALCGGDMDKFITYTGFGNSAAFLSSKGMLSQNSNKVNSGDEVTAPRVMEIDQEKLEADKQYQDIRDKLDPITGQIQAPKRNPMEGMSEEEKELHAHELANAIAKLSKIGIMKPMGLNLEGETSEIQPRTSPLNNEEGKKDSDSD